MYRIPLLLAMVLLAACGQPVFDDKLVTLKLTPQQVSERSTPQAGEFVIWGGIILDTKNLADGTRIEVLAYPLDRMQQPRVDDTPQGRFLIRESAYLEPVSYAQGRRISVFGKLGANQSGKIGESDYRFPVVEAEKLKLWPQGGSGKTRFHFGLGIQL